MKKLSVKMKLYEQILGWIYLPFQLVGVALIIGIINLLLGGTMTETEINILYFGINFIAVIAIFHSFLWGNLKSFFSHFWKNIGFTALGFVMYWALSILVSIFILWIQPDFANANDDTIAAMLETAYWPMFICTVLLVPITEETLYRGLLFGVPYNRNKLLGYLTSIVVFSAVHVVPYVFIYDLTQAGLAFLQYLPACFVLAFVYAKTDSLFAGVLIHTLINLIGILVAR